jgi:hypothetical protein
MFGRMLASTEASRYSIGSGRYGTSFGRLERLTDRRLDGMARSSGRLTGNLNSSDLQAESSDITLNSEILVYCIFYILVFFVHTQNEANKTNKLPLWPFWDKKHLTGLEIHSRSK